MKADRIIRAAKAPAGRILRGLVLLLLTGAPAVAQSPSEMTNACARVGQSYFREPAARTDMQYNGQRTDGTHAVNGRIFLETRAEDFACSFDRTGERMVQFFAEGAVGNAYLPGAGSAPGATASPGLVQVTGIAANDVLNVRSGPSTRFRVIGALSNGTQVRTLECRIEAGSRWCRIQMLDDMRSEGWVNARYLSEGLATQLPTLAPQAPSGGVATQLPTPAPEVPVAVTMRTERVRFPSGATGTELRAVLSPGSSVRYVLGARDRQNLYVRVATRSPSVSYQIFNPNGTFLLNQMTSDRDYRGELWQTGDHVVEVINRGDRPVDFNVILGVQ